MRHPKYRKATVGPWILLGKLYTRKAKCHVCGKPLVGEQLVYSDRKQTIMVGAECVKKFEKEYQNPRKSSKGLLATMIALPFIPPNPKKAYRTITTFHSKSKPGKIYTVKIDELGGLSCDCPRWLYHVDRECYHVRVVRSEIRNPGKSIPRYCLYCGMTKEECAKVRRQIHERCCPKCTHWRDKESTIWRKVAPMLIRKYDPSEEKLGEWNPEEKKIRPLVSGMTASERKAVREDEEVMIREWLNKIRGAKDLIVRRAVIKDMINQAKKEPDLVRVVGEVIKRGRLHEKIETMRLRKLLNPISLYESLRKPTETQLERWAKMPDPFDNVTDEDRKRAWDRGCVI